MRIVHITLSLHPRGGGPTTVIAAMARAQQARGDEVCLVSSDLAEDAIAIDTLFARVCGPEPKPPRHTYAGPASASGAKAMWLQRIIMPDGREFMDPLLEDALAIEAERRERARRVLGQKDGE